MNDTREATEPSALPRDPEMAAADPAMFAPMTRDENKILNAHLTSGMHKQSAVYPILSEPWRETGALIDDLNSAWWTNWHAEHPAAERQEPAPDTPEAGQ